MDQWQQENARNGITVPWFQSCRPVNSSTRKAQILREDDACFSYVTLY